MPAPQPAPEGHIVARATSDRYAEVPALLYWNTRTGWGPYNQATRYNAHWAPTVRDLVLNAIGQHGLPHPSAVLDWTPALPTDLDGYPYRHDDDTLTPWRVTPCCAAAPGIDDGPLYCKSCHHDVDPALDTPARLDANWNPGDGPIRIDL